MLTENVMNFLKSQLDQVNRLTCIRDYYPTLQEWHAATRPYIGRYFPGELPKFDEYLKVRFFAVLPNSRGVEFENDMIVKSARDKLAGLLRSLIQLQEIESTDSPINVPITLSPRVFVVHGHDDSMKQTVARTLEKLNLQPIILHEQPNEGRTIIEKFEKNADVGFAVILLSPDDRTFSATQSHKEALPCARQNVILELGYFVGRLSRNRVFCLKRNDVLIPSDFHGVVYTPYDPNGNWELELVKELRAAGYAVDANRLISSP